MILLTILSIIGVVLILLSYKIKIPTGKGKTLSLTIPAFILGIVFIGVGVMSTSLVNPDSNSIGIKKKIYGTAELTGGQIIATNGEKGLQADIVQPGFQIIPLINVFYDVEEIDIFEVPAGHLGVLVAKDGIKLRDGQYIADSWKDLYKGKNSYDMINPVVFLKNGGQAGPQMDVLKPGKYKLNTHLWKVTLAKATKVKPGHVMVIKSNAGDANDKSCISDKRPTDGATLTSPLVKEGCFGVWDTPKYPGNYYLNPTAYEAHIVPTQLFTWTYKGGYMIQDVAIERNEKGEMKIVKGEKVNVPIPQGAADGAIQALSKDAHEFNTEWSIQAQVKPEDAPFLIASIGSIANAEDRVVTPLARSVVRNNSEKVNGDAFIGKREQIESDLEKTIIPEGKKVGITIRDARLRSPGMPPELRLALVRKDLAKKNKLAFDEERKTEKARIAMEKEKATANQQTILVTAEIGKKAAKLEGEGERIKLTEIAKGQQKLANVLGPERAMQLQALEKALNAAVKNPDIVKVPYVQVSGGAGGLEGAAAVLGSSNIIKSMTSLQSISKNEAK